MKIFALLISLLMCCGVLFGQLSDLEIVQSLISKNHVNIRTDLNDLGLSYTQKKQALKSDSITRNIFFIHGKENNIKSWEIYTQPVNGDTNRITEIIIKYYYDQPGDLIELDRFVVPEDNLINGLHVDYEKSEGRKQAHIKIMVTPQQQYLDEIRKKTGYYKILSESQENLFINLEERYSGAEDKNLFFMNVLVKGSFSCAGQKDNSLLLIFMDNDSLFIDQDLSDYKCDISVISKFLILEDDLKRLSAMPVNSIRLKQGNNEYNIIPDDELIFVKMKSELNIKLAK